MNKVVSEFFVGGYDLRQLTSSYQLICDSSCIEITNPVVWQLLQQLEAYRFQRISRFQLESMCTSLELEYEKICTLFTVNLCLLQGLFEDSIQTLALDIDDRMLHDALVEDCSRFCKVVTYSDVKNAYGDDNTIVLCYRQQYDDLYFEQAIQNLSANQYIVCAGMAHSILQIDNMFSHNSGFPSHFSNLHNLQQTVSSGFPFSSDDWLLFYRRLCQLERPILPVNQPTCCQKGYIAYCLMRFVARILNSFSDGWLYVDECQYFWAVDLQTNNIVREVACHSPFDVTLNYGTQTQGSKQAEKQGDLI